MENEMDTEQETPQLKPPKKNCRYCFGRGVVTFILRKDEVTGEDVKETKPCHCRQRISDNKHLTQRMKL